jgi:hypothetical protein
MKQVPITYETSRMKYKAKNATNVIPNLRRTQPQNQRTSWTEYAPGTLERYQTSLKHTKALFLEV